MSKETAAHASESIHVMPPTSAQASSHVLDNLDVDSTAVKAKATQEQLIDSINALIAPLGYEVIHVEFSLGHRQKILRIFIDHIDNLIDNTKTDASGRKFIGIEDCVKVSKLLNGPPDTMNTADPFQSLGEVFKGHYELEVSSPGIERPLRKLKDFERFKGQEARIQLYRPLTAEEIENPAYLQKNSKQKNFLGTLLGIRNDKVFVVIAESSTKKAEILIPLPLISKANLEPHKNQTEGESHERGKSK